MCSFEMNKNNLPTHIAIIMDGNGRWAKERGLPKIMGHRQGVEAVQKTVEACAEIGIKVLTLYTFSKENWQRPKEEVNALMMLLNEFIDKEKDNLKKKNIRLNIIGRIEDLPQTLVKKLKELIEATRCNTGLILNMALSYGSRSEIVEATKRLSNEVILGKIRPGEIDENLFSKYLWTAGLPDPDLLIRTSGEMRVSNFLLWQISYAELYFTEKFWPDFDKGDLLKAIQEYQKRIRRFGK